MDFDPHLTAGRRFSMTVAIAVFLYAYSRNALSENLSFVFFGITFPVSRFELDMLFLLLPGYAAFRYFHLAWVQSTPPWRIRNLMKDKKQLPLQFFTSDPTTENARVLYLIQQAQRYFPYLDPLLVWITQGTPPKHVPRSGSVNMASEAGIDIPELSRKTRFWCRVNDLHYALPLLCLVGAVVFLGCHIYFQPEPPPPLVLPEF